MYIFALVVLIVLCYNVVNGYKKGMVKEFVSLVSLLVLGVVATLLANGIKSYFKGSIGSVIIVVLLLMVIGTVHHLLGIVFFSMKLVSKLPIVHWADKMLGIVFGVLETILMLWVLYTIIMLLDIGMLGQQILIYTQENELLRWVYNHNYLAIFLKQMSLKISLMPIQGL